MVDFPCDNACSHARVERFLCSQPALIFHGEPRTQPEAQEICLKTHAVLAPYSQELVNWQESIGVSIWVAGERVQTNCDIIAKQQLTILGARCVKKFPFACIEPFDACVDKPPPAQWG